ncbi:MAG: lipoyl(octanoyl) transferase LipB [Gammaproteobacteria bacterium]|nr:lipoyl(octanoyl) transferase LipB [Gammaproteobacteria bacterium]
MTVIIRKLGLVDYTESWAAMRAFTDQRSAETPDEIWFVEHPPVFTQGLAGSPAHLLAPGDIPVVQSDRGGQVTYHGPGQLVAYVLLDLRRLGLGPRELVRRLESAVIAVLAHYGLQGQRRAGAPGVYVDEAKIAALGLRVRRQCSYHGLALNVAPDLSPFGRINPCGYSNLAVTSLAQLGKRATLTEATGLLEQALRTAFESPASITATVPRPEPAVPAPLTG